MPTYDYHCDACGHRFEQWQQISEAKLVTCPKCRKRRLQRLIGAGSGLIFKGTGFYVTDYKRKGASPAPESAASGAADAKPAEASGSGARSDAVAAPAPKSGKSGKKG